MKKIKIKCPATVANIVCGFDVLGLCLDAPYDEMEMQLTSDGKVNIFSANGFQLPSDPTLNTAGLPLLAMQQKIDPSIGFNLILHKKIKPGSGLGSSAASAAGAVVGANYLLGNLFNKLQLTEFAMLGEALASGTSHADNVAPCIFGGVTIVRQNNPLDVIDINHPPLFVVVIHPQIEIKTSEARKILPANISLKDASQQWANVAALVAGFMKQDAGIISRSLTDHIVEPVRKKLIPQFDELKAACMQAGSMGGGISGSGPSVFMLAASEIIAQKIELAMNAVYTKTSIPFYTQISAIGQGVSVSALQ